MLVVVLALGCEKDFHGPWPCEPGYASCNGNACATNILTDPSNCGGCNQTCDIGAACTNSACGAGASTVAQLMTTPSGGGNTFEIAANSTTLFWMNQGGGSCFIQAYPFAGGSPHNVPGQQQPGTQGGAWSLNGCGGGTPFAVDDTSAYVMGQITCMNTGAPGVPPCNPNNGVIRVSLADGTASALSNNITTQFNGLSSMAVDATNVYALSNMGPSATYAIYAFPLTGGGQRTITTIPSSGPTPSMVVKGGRIVYSTPSNYGPAGLSVVPTSGGGSPMALAVNATGYGGWSSFTADGSYAYTAGSGCPCNNNNGNNNNGGGGGFPPQGQVTKFPLDGSPGTVLGQISGSVKTMTVDSTAVYVLTDQGVWKVPIDAGPTVQIAGNLNGGAGTSFLSLCYANNCGGGNNFNSYEWGIALGPNSAYFLDPFDSTLYSVPK
jgi:hypothetical protein